MDLSYYKSIESLPTTIGDLKHLTKLLLQECENFEGASSKHWKHLFIINIGLIYCKFIESLPTIIGDLKHLIKLLSGGCENLKEVP